MSKKTNQTAPCSICNNTSSTNEKMPIELLDEPLNKYLRIKYPKLSSNDSICLACLDKVRAEYVMDLLSTEKGELSAIDKDVVNSLKEQELLAKNTNLEFDQKLTFGQKLADKVAEFGGSWKFIILFGSILVIWIIINSTMLLIRPFDPFPYILLNLVLSCLAAIQAPVIMMSQNRHAEKDRLQADHDYRTNLKAELEIRQINNKMDQLLMHHWQRLLDIQRIQMELMEELVNRTAQPKDN